MGADLGGAVKGFKEGMKSSETDAGTPPAEPPPQVSGNTIEGEVRKEPSQKV
jgi:sec-independent protein translocase protein TatA